MTAPKLLLLLILLPTALIYPGWRAAQSGPHYGLLPFLLPPGGTLLWFALAWGGFGAQSLGNLIEIYIVCALAICVAYVKFWWLDRKFKRGLHSASAAWAILITAIVMLRLLMPTLPE